MSDFLSQIQNTQRRFVQPTPLYAAGSPEEIDAFEQLQRGLSVIFETSFPDPLSPKTVVVLPSTTLDEEILGELEGELHYEERMLSMLMLLRMPRTHLVYVTSTPLDPVIVDYYLHLLPGVPSWHARKRLTLLSCYDLSPKSLTQKVLERPRLIEAIKRHVSAEHPAHLACYNVTALERTLAVQLGIPIYGCDPQLLHWGTKSGSRTIFRKAGVALPAGFENLSSEQEVAEALTQLKQTYPALRKAVVKLNEGFGGEGNAIFSYQDAPSDGPLGAWIAQQLPHRLQLVAPMLTYEMFMRKMAEMRGIVEVFLEGDIKTSPSVQCRITPLGQVEIISTHDQVLRGASGQVFIGASFPAASDYCIEIGEMGERIAKEMANLGVLGRFGVDFISVKQPDGWQHYAIEINLRKGGTTHPFLMLQLLTHGHYEAHTGCYQMPNGQTRCYFASDSLKSDLYRGTTPQDLIEIAVFHGLHYDGASQEGVMFHMIGAMSEFGKLGVVCIASTPQKAQALYHKTVEVFEFELKPA
ncbi:MAG: peptide ligase PGM1-related protein [Spirosomaceae bacterium]|nr:peptide ligase PGM1-related protein [Spirosomataceae bacterium]